MSEGLEAIARRWWDEGLNKHNVNLADELMDAEYVLHDATFGDIRGPEAFKQFVAGYFHAFPDAHCTVESVVAAGDECAVRWSFSGTHQGEFMGIAPTGRPITDVGAFAAFRARGGRHLEAWQVVDVLGLLRQLGAASPQAEANKALVRRYCDEFLNQADWSVAEEIFAADYILRGPHLPEIRGPEAMKQFHMALRAGVPDVRFTVVDMIAEGEKVALVWSEAGTMTGEWMGIAPSGKSYQVSGIDTLRILDGKIAEEHAEVDFFSFLRQIGVSSPRAEANKKLVRRYMEEIWNQGKIEVVDEIFAADSYLNAVHSAEFRGLDARKEFVGSLRAAFPDMHYTIEDLTAEGDRVTLRWSHEGTHRGEWFGSAPTGNVVRASGTSVFRCSEGKIEEELVQWDALGYMQQLGVIPTPGQSARGRD